MHAKREDCGTNSLVKWIGWIIPQNFMRQHSSNSILFISKGSIITSISSSLLHFIWVVECSLTHLSCEKASHCASTSHGITSTTTTIQGQISRPNDDGVGNKRHSSSSKNQSRRARVGLFCEKSMIDVRVSKKNKMGFHFQPILSGSIKPSSM